MTDAPKLPRVENRLSTGNLITILFGALALAVAWGTLQADIRALAQRVDKGETRDDKTADALEAIKGSIIRIETEQKAVRSDAERVSRQLDRLETLIRNGAPSHPQPPRVSP